MISSTKPHLSNFNRILKLFGIDIIRFLKTISGIKFYLENYLTLRKQKKMILAFILGNYILF